MLTFVTIVHVFLCVFMIFVILLQPGKDAGMGAALGGGAATSAFGGRGAVTFLSKLTAICAALFFFTSLGLSFVGMRRSVTSAIVNKTPATKPVTAPETATPEATAAPEGAKPADSTPPLNVPRNPAVPVTPVSKTPNPAQEPQKSK